MQNESECKTAGGYFESIYSRINKIAIIIRPLEALGLTIF